RAHPAGRPPHGHARSRQRRGGRLMRALAYFFSEAAESLWRSRHAAILSTLTIAAGLFVLGFFLMINTNLQGVIRGWTEAAELAVYLRDDVKPEQASALNDMIGRSGLTTGVQYFSKDDARREFARDFPDLAPAAAQLDHNPFPASFEVRLNSRAQDATGAI